MAGELVEDALVVAVGRGGEALALRPQVASGLLAERIRAVGLVAHRLAHDPRGLREGQGSAHRNFRRCSLNLATRSGLASRQARATAAKSPAHASQRMRGRPRPDLAGSSTPQTTHERTSLTSRLSEFLSLFFAASGSGVNERAPGPQSPRHCSDARSLPVELLWLG
jgi:hypothetical protein